MEENKKTEEVVVVDKHGKRHKGVVDLVSQTDDAFLEQVGGFKNFLRDYAVVGLALGFIVGQQANGVVKQFVDSFLNPMVELLFGGKNLSGRTATVHHDQQAIPIHWGAFVYALIEFFFVLIAIYMVIKWFKLDKYTGKTDEPKK